MGIIANVVAKVLGGLDDGVIAEGKLGTMGGVFPQKNGEEQLYLRKDATLFDKLEQKHLEATGLFLRETAFRRKVVLVYNWTGMIAKDEEADMAKEAAGQAAKQQRVAQRKLESLRRTHERDLTAGRVIAEQLAQLPNVKLGSNHTDSGKLQKVVPGTMGVPTLFISDVHYAETVDPAQINNMNTYDLAIADKRLATLFSNAQKMVGGYVKTDSTGMVVALGGDMLSGNIHDELRESNAVPIIEAARLLALRLSEGIHELAGQFKTVQVPCVVGNHGRMSHKPAAKGAVDNNFDKLVYLFMAEMLRKDTNVSMFISDSLDLDFRIFNTRYKLTHGDQFKSAGGVGGIYPSLIKGVNRKQERASRLGQTFDFLMMGHFHQLGFVENMIVNGSVKGYDEYAFRMNLPLERAQQALWITHPEEGMTIKAPVFCDERSVPERSSEGCLFTIAA